MLTFFLVAAGAFVILVIYLVLTADKRKNSFRNNYTENGKLFVARLEEMWNNNESFNWGGEILLYEEMFGSLPARNIDELEKATGVFGYLNEEEGSPKYIAGDYLTNLASDLVWRYDAEHSKLEALNEKEAMEKYGLNIHSDELVHKRFKTVDWYEEKTVTTSVSYGGYRYRSGGNLAYTFGSLSVSKTTRDYFAPIDRGDLYITNKRLLFVGVEKHTNKTVSLEDILEFSLYQDGILVGKSNGKKPLLVLEDYVFNIKKAPNKRDTVNLLSRILDRVLRKNQFEEV